MKKKFAVGLMCALIVMCGACALFQGQTTKTETIVIGYESIATIAFPTVQTYLAQREANGSLSGSTLANAKANYSLAKSKFIQAGDLLKASISNPALATSNMAVSSGLLKEIAAILAGLSGGSVSGNQLTLPTVGGK